jgi:hypothetical protein
MRGVVLAVLVAALGSPAGAQEITEKKSRNQPGGWIDLQAMLFTGIGYDEAFDAAGWGLRGTWLTGRGRPYWVIADVAAFSSFDSNDPYTFSGELLVGLAVWMRDNYQHKWGKAWEYVAVKNTEGQVTGWQLRQYDTGGGFVYWADVVLAVGARSYVFAGTNVRDVVVEPVLAPEVGLWYHQEMRGWAGHSRLRMGLFGAYEPFRGAFGLFGNIDVTAWRRLSVGLHIGGIFGEVGGMEFSGMLGLEL